MPRKCLSFTGIYTLHAAYVFVIYIYITFLVSVCHLYIHNMARKCLSFIYTLDAS